MSHPTDALHCPQCRSTLEQRHDSLRCAPCSADYPLVFGIPDLRISDPPYVSREEERHRIEQLMETFDSMSYEDLVRHYVYEIERPETAGKAEKDLAHRLSLRERAKERAHVELDQLAGIDSPLTAGSVVLDLGCGSCEAIVGLHERGLRPVGIDISIEELILGRKLCLQQGLGEPTLVACNAEALPFSGERFDFIFAMDVIEHVTDQELFLREARRVLRRDGRLLFNSPNRFSVLAPEPHVGLWWMGFLPRALMDPYSRLRGKGRYTGKRLLSIFELRRLTRRVFQRNTILRREPNPAPTSTAGRLYKALAPLSVTAYDWIREIHTVVCVRSDSDGSGTAA